MFEKRVRRGGVSASLLSRQSVKHRALSNVIVDVCEVRWIQGVRKASLTVRVARSGGGVPFPWLL